MPSRHMLALKRLSDSSLLTRDSSMQSAESLSASEIQFNSGAGVPARLCAFVPRLYGGRATPAPLKTLLVQMVFVIYRHSLTRERASSGA